MTRSHRWRLGRRSVVPVLAAAAVLPLGHGGVRAEPPRADAPSIPEPMVFDLVRPLGARTGELEVNVLTVRPFSRGPTSWAPEVEYVYADGQSVEFEFPFEDGRLTQLKLALQGTFGTGAGGRWIHGWQYIGLYDRDRRTTESSLLYISGYRFDARWSTLAMAGLRQVGFGAPGPTYLLFNHSTFYDADAATVLGVELNLRQGVVADETTRLRVIPQIHYRVTQLTSVQFGLGAEFRTGSEPGLFAALRVVRDF